MSCDYEVVDVNMLQDDLDKLALSLFQAARSFESFQQTEEITLKQQTLQHNTELISAAFERTSRHIESLIGLDKTPQQQEQELLVLSQEYNETKERIQKLEKQLAMKRKNIDEEIKLLLR